MRKDIGQIFMIGIASTSLEEEERDFLKEYNIGGVILFERNYADLEQLVELINEIRSLNKVSPLFLAVDQEGGTVIRFKEPFSQFPGNDFLGRYYEKTGSLDLVREYAKVTARELRAVGINICLAPVVDVLTNPENKVIGNRAFSDKKDVVALLGAAVIRGFIENGIMACAKHFPGHGDTALDSHKTLPSVKHNLDFIKSRELIPFQRAIEEDVPFIMTSHILYESIDSEYPATLSKKMIWDILRGEMGYKNLVISDDFEMKGISDNYDLEEAGVLALSAGVDIILICHSLKKVLAVYKSVVKEYGRNSNLRTKVGESLERVKRLKEKYKVSGVKVDLKVARGAFNPMESQKLVSKIKTYV